MELSTKNTLRNTKKLILWHCIGWFLFALYDNLGTILFANAFYKGGLLYHQILFSLYDVGASVFIFYSLIYILHFFFTERKLISIVGVMIIFLISIFLNYVGSKLFIELGLGNIAEKTFERVVIIGALQFFIPLFVFALAYVFGTSVVKKQKQINSLQKKNIHTERQNKNREIQNILLQNAFLRAQINPHFLYNTLNFFYAQSLKYSGDLAEGILTLSEIMRYSLKQPLGTGHEKVLLSHEIDHIKNIIKINRLRYKNNIFLNFNVEGNTKGIYIVPFVLITITENVFKHGEINNPNFTATIRIKVDESGINLYCHNKKKGGIKEPGTGIGLENTRQRLAYEYGNNFSLRSKDGDAFFTTEMNIGFNQKIKNETS